jgi:hypothetical protein
MISIHRKITLAFSTLAVLATGVNNAAVSLTDAINAAMAQVPGKLAKVDKD